MQLVCCDLFKEMLYYINTCPVDHTILLRILSCLSYHPYVIMIPSYLNLYIVFNKEMGEKSKVGGMRMSTQTVTYCIQRNSPVLLCTSMAEYFCTAHCFASFVYRSLGVLLHM